MGLPPIPDHKIYKIDGIKDLEWTRAQLAERGLKDPWLRNEVWRYQHWKGHGPNFINVFKQGFKWAAAAMVITIAADKIFGLHDDHHGHDKH